MYSEPPAPSTRFTTVAWAPLVALLGFFAVALWEYDPAAFVGDAPIVRLSQSPVCRGKTGMKATQTFPSFLAANASHSSRIPATSQHRVPPIFLTAVAVCQEPASVLSWVEKLCHRPDPRRGDWRVTIYHQCDENNFGTLPSPNLRRSGHLGTAHALAELDRGSSSSSSGSSSGGGARWPSFNRFNRTWPSGPCIQHMWNRSVGTGREQEAYLSHIVRYYRSLEVSRDHKLNRRRLQLEKQEQVQEKRWSKQQQVQGEKEEKKQALHQVEQKDEQKHEQKHQRRRQLGRAKGWRLGQSASSSSRGNHGRQEPQQAERTYLVFLQADADSEFKLPPFVGDPAAALEAMAAADDDDDDDDDGGGGGDGKGGGKAERKREGSSSSATSGYRATSRSSGNGRSHDGSSAAGLLGFASLTGTAFRTPPPQSFRKRVAPTWLNPVDNRAPRARYLCRWSPVELAMQASSGVRLPVAPSSTTAAAASAAAAGVPPLSAAASAASAAPRSRPPLSRYRASEEVDCRRAYLTPSRAQFVVSPLRVKALPFETWDALHALSVTSTGVATDPFEHSWAALFGCLLPADCPKAERLLSKRHASPIGLECHD